MRGTLVRQAVCDQEAFYPFERLVSGPFTALKDLDHVEEFIRSVVLHDEIRMEFEPLPYDPTRQAAPPQGQAGLVISLLALAPLLDRYGFFSNEDPKDPGTPTVTIPFSPPKPPIVLAPSLMKIAANFSNAPEGSIFCQGHVDYLSRVLGVVNEGGSALLSSKFGLAALDTASAFPMELFNSLDHEWKSYAQDAAASGLGLLVPPVLSIVLHRCAKREAIPVVVRDLRDEWSGARRKVWDLVDRLRTCPTLDEAQDVKREFGEASRYFSPAQNDWDSRPIRVLWEILAATAAGALVAHLSGGKPVIAAATTGILQAAKSIPPLLHEFGPALFGRGAMDLAGCVRRGVSNVGYAELTRLLTDIERHRLTEMPPAGN